MRYAQMVWHLNSGRTLLRGNPSEEVLCEAVAQIFADAHHMKRALEVRWRLDTPADTRLLPTPHNRVLQQLLVSHEGKSSKCLSGWVTFAERRVRAELLKPSSPLRKLFAAQN